MHGEKERKNRWTRITAAACTVVLVFAAGFIVLSGAGKTSVEAVSLPELTPSPYPSLAAQEEYSLSDADVALLGMALDDTGLSLMPSGFAFAEVEDPEQVVEENSLSPGVHDERVISIKERLMELKYMESDAPDDYYGEQTAYAVQLFQRSTGLEVTGSADDETIALLMSDEAPVYLMTVGMNGTDVEEIQKRLKQLGYLKVKVTGYFGADTREAVLAFQKNNSLSQDGCVGEQTREALYSSSAKKAGEKATPSKSPTASKSASPSKSAPPTKTAASAKPSSPGASEQPTAEKPTDPPKTDLPSPDSGKVETFINYAQTLLGMPYVLGGKGPDKFDCSGFIYYALNQSGVKSIGYMTSGGWANSSFPTVPKDSLQRGDILCFNGHVGIYLGGGKMLDASSNEGKIRITSNIWSNSYWNKNFKFGKRALY